MAIHSTILQVLYPQRWKVHSTYLGRAIPPGLTLCNKTQIIFNPRLHIPRANFPLDVYSDIPVDGLNRSSLTQEKKERPTVTKLRFCNGIKQLRGCLIGQLLPFCSGNNGEAL